MEEEVSTMVGTQVIAGRNARSAAVHVSKPHVAYEWIKERISDGRFTSGYRLVLTQIAKDLNVSVVPVREAVRMLQAEGLVTFERNVGAQVAMADPSEYVYTMQTLTVVEGVATALAAPHIPRDSIRRAREVNTHMKDCVANFDPRRLTDLNLEFHVLLFERCPNPFILDLVYRGWNRLKVLRSSIFGFIPARAAESVQEHERIVQLIESGAKPIEIELATREHRNATLDAFLAFQAQKGGTSDLLPESDAPEGLDGRE